MTQNALVPPKKRKQVKDAVASGGKDGRVFQKRSVKGDVLAGEREQEVRPADVELIEGVQNNDIEKVKQAIGKNANLDNINVRIKGRTALMYACLMEYNEIAKLLVESGADLDNDDGEGSTAFTIATLSGNLEMLKYLKEKGVNMEAFGASGGALHHAVNCTDHDKAYECIKWLIEQEITSKINETCFNGGTPLKKAAEVGNNRVVKLFIENGADVNKRNEGSNTPLHAAARNEHLDVVQTLLENQAEVNAVNSNGITPLMFAVSNADEEMTRLLLNRGADLDLKDKYERDVNKIIELLEKPDGIKQIIKEARAKRESN